MIDHNSPVPLYYQIYEDLLEKIEQEEFHTHEPIPSEKELENQYRVSRPTVRNAINALVQNGYLYRQRGVGTFVSKPKIKRNVQELLSFTEEMRLRGFEPQSEIISIMEFTVARKIANILSLPDADSVVEIKRIRFVDDEPVGVHTSYLAKSRLPRVDLQDFENMTSLYKLLEDKYGIRIDYADEILEAAPASQEEAEMLDVPINSPVLLVERVAYSDKGEPVEYVKMVYPANRYKYYSHLTRV